MTVARERKPLISHSLIPTPRDSPRDRFRDLLFRISGPRRAFPSASSSSDLGLHGADTPCADFCVRRGSDATASLTELRRREKALKEKATELRTTRHDNLPAGTETSTQPPTPLGRRHRCWPSSALNGLIAGRQPTFSRGAVRTVRRSLLGPKSRDIRICRRAVNVRWRCATSFPLRASDRRLFSAAASQELSLLLYDHRRPTPWTRCVGRRRLGSGGRPQRAWEGHNRPVG